MDNNILNSHIYKKLSQALGGNDLAAYYILSAYNESHRHYHNFSHIENMIKQASEEGIISTDLFLAIVFHDVVYDPKENNNEEKSVDIFKIHFDKPQVVQAILETKTHQPESELGKTLCYLDLSIRDSSLRSLMKFEDKIFKEYQWVDYSTYREKRVEILRKLNFNNSYINYVKFRKPKIALYAGSFNPFHVGHYNILQKAERIFDKVIIARGNNKQKLLQLSHEWTAVFPEPLKYHQTLEYDGLLTDLIKSFDYDITLIRGLRNALDMQYELTQYRFLQDLMPEIKVVNIFCDREYEHISSSAIRQLNSFGDKASKYLL